MVFTLLPTVNTMCNVYSVNMRYAHMCVRKQCCPTLLARHFFSSAVVVICCLVSQPVHFFAMLNKRRHSHTRSHKLNSNTVCNMYHI